MSASVVLYLSLSTNPYYIAKSEREKRKKRKIRAIFCGDLAGIAWRGIGVS